MKRVIAVMFCLLCVMNQAFSQDSSKGVINISFSKGANDVVRFIPLDGGGSYEGTGFYSLGLSYQKSLSNRLDLEVGMGYLAYGARVTSDYYPGRDVTTSEDNGVLLSVPVTVRANFWKYFFFNTGFVIDYEARGTFIDPQSGIGIIAGTGVQYSFTPKVTAFINPYLQQHTIVGFTGDFNQQRLFDAGIRAGVGISL